MQIKIILSSLIVFFMVGCQAIVYGTASDFQNISLGMTKEEVIKRIGSPVSVAADGKKGEEYFIYKRMKHAISEWPRTYKVTFENNKVIKYGEQYNEANVNNF